MRSVILGTVGPLSLTEHVLWLGVMSLGVFLVYNGLRTESVNEAVRRGVRRWATFLAGCLVLALLSSLLAEML